MKMKVEYNRLFRLAEKGGGSGGSGGSGSGGGGIAAMNRESIRDLGRSYLVPRCDGHLTLDTHSAID